MKAIENTGYSKIGKAKYNKVCLNEHIERIFMSNNSLKAIHKVIDYIYKNIGIQLTIKELASVAGFSEYHFHRIFSAYTGEALSSFVKRIRLEKSAHRLAYSNINITEVALASGYETPSAYTKAFKQLFGVNPSEYKIAKNHIFAIKQNKEYDNKLRRLIMENFVGIKELDDIKIIAVRKTGKYSDAAHAAWTEICKFAYSSKIKSADSKMIGISYDNPTITAEENLRYDACITVDKEIKTEGNVFNSVVQGGKFAVFLHKGPYENLMETYTAIFAKWLPDSKYKLRELPAFEMYLNKFPDKTKPENLRTEIYVPIE